MPNNRPITIQCPNCGQPIQAVIETIIDATNDPQAKLRLLSGQVNLVQCPHCGVTSTVAAPLVYHDANKELLITFVPMQLGVSKEEQEKTVGRLIREVTNNLPAEGRKGYIFRPREALTMQGLIDQILEADGVTPEMMEQQRARVRLAEMFMQATPETLPALVQEHDAEIDAGFFQTLTAIAQRMATEGRMDVAQHIVGLQGAVAELSSYGQQIIQQAQLQEQTIQEVAQTLQSLGDNPQRSDFIKLVVQYADSDEHLQALVGLVRPVFDYTFFQEFTIHIGQAPSAERDRLENLREKLVELTTIMDQQTQAEVQNAAAFLQAVINNPNREEFLRTNADMLDDTFMQVLTINIQEAERRGNLQATAMIREVYELVVRLLQENMQPELRFINDFLSSEADEEALALVREHGHEFDSGLFDVLKAVEQTITNSGDENLKARLALLRDELTRVLE